MNSTDTTGEEPSLKPEESLRSNVIISLGIAICGVLVVGFPYYANYGPAWSGRFFFFGYAVICIGFLLSAIVSAAANVGRGFLLTGGVILFPIIGLDSWAASLGRDSAAGTVVELLILLLAVLAILCVALGLGLSSTPPQRESPDVIATNVVSSEEAPQPPEPVGAWERRTPVAIAILAFLTAVVQSVIAIFGE